MSWILVLNEQWFEDVVQEYFNHLSIASSRLLYEINQAVRIQSWWRGVSWRLHLKLLNERVVQIQQLYRGYRGRQLFKITKLEHAEYLRRLCYDHAATLIQKIYRGFYSRKTRFDFYARRRYIKTVQIEGDELNRKLTEQLELSRQITEEKEKVEAAKEFHTITASLHHLLSTAGRPGIFRSSYGEAYSAKAFDIPVEDHIRDAFKIKFRKSKTGRKLLQKKERINTKRMNVDKA